MGPNQTHSTPFFSQKLRGLLQKEGARPLLFEHWLQDAAARNLALCWGSE